jgi:hypothetical protein
MEGKDIAVWVYSNLDRVELFHNGQSLGAKDVKKDSHAAWVVKYAPGSLEARGFKDGKQVLSTTRETTGPASKLILTADRNEINADGEDVAMFAVEVQDAQGFLRMLHGVGAIVKECWEHSDRGSIARSHIGQRQHRCQGSEAASTGGGVGTRGAVR